MSYDPTIGRWTTEDPIAFEGGDANLYRYIGNSPTNFTDPSGLQAKPKPIPSPVKEPPLPPTSGPRYPPPAPITPGIPANINQLNQNPYIRDQYKQAWRDSLPDPNHKIKESHEEGGWIFQECNGTGLKVIRATPAEPDPENPDAVAHIDLNNPPQLPGYALIGAFHTHPFMAPPGCPNSDPVRRQKQGGGDILWAWKHGIPNIVVSEKGLFCAGPQITKGLPDGAVGPGGLPDPSGEITSREVSRPGARVCRRPHGPDGAGPAVTDAAGRRV
jgi:hypothetical protein